MCSAFLRLHIESPELKESSLSSSRARSREQFGAMSHTFVGSPDGLSWRVYGGPAGTLRVPCGALGVCLAVAITSLLRASCR